MHNQPIEIDLPAYTTARALANKVRSGIYVYKSAAILSFCFRSIVINIYVHLLVAEITERVVSTRC